MKKEDILNYKKIKDKIISLMKEINPDSKYINFREIGKEKHHGHNFFNYFKLDEYADEFFEEDDFYNEFNNSRVGWSVYIENEKSQEIASFNLTEMPSCCKYIVAQNFLAINNSKFEPLIELMEFFAQLLEYTCILYTNSTGNRIIPLLERKNYQILECNINRRTANEIGLFLKEIDALPFYSDEFDCYEPEIGDVI